MVRSHLTIFCFRPSAGYDENYAVAKAAGKYSNVLNANFNEWDASGAALRPLEKVIA